MTKDSAAIRDQLGNDPDTVFVLNADYFETIGVEELALAMSEIVLEKSLVLFWG